MLKHLHKRNACPHCASPVTKKEVDTWPTGRIRQHTNGQQFESVQFACGFRIEWSPNASGPINRGICRKSATTLAALETQQELLSDIRKALRKLAAKYKANPDFLVENLGWDIKRLDSNYSTRLWSKDSG